MLSMNNMPSICSPTGIPFFTEKVPCGFPSPGSDCREEPLDFNELLVPHRAASYCIRAGGDSMMGAGIFAGDILVVDRSIRPVFGDIVVAEYDGGFTVKRLLRPDSQDCKAILHPENPDYDDIHVSENAELTIFGVVSAVVRRIDRSWQRTGEKASRRRIS